EADTFTLGFVLNFEPVTLAVDWYEIDLKDAIDTPAFATIYQQCMDPRFNPLMASPAGTYTGAELAAGNQFCQYINREYVGGEPLTPGNFGAARTFDAQYTNLGGLKSEGFDVQVDWRFDVGVGLMNLNVVASFLDTYSEQAFSGAQPIDYAGTLFNSSYDYRTFTTLRFDKGPWSLGLRWTHWPSIDPQPGSSADAFGTESHDRFDLFGNWSFGDRYRLRFGIDNLLDEDPAVVGRT